MIPSALVVLRLISVPVGEAHCHSVPPGTGWDQMHTALASMHVWKSAADAVPTPVQHVTATVIAAQTAAPPTTRRNDFTVFLPSSVAATAPGPYYATYAASKAFLYSFAEAIRHELRESGVTITVLMPGPTDTAFFERAGMEDTKLGAMENKDDPAEVARQGFQALMAGRDHVVAASLKSKVQVTAAKVMPAKTKAKLQAGMAEPGSAGTPIPPHDADEEEGER